MYEDDTEIYASSKHGDELVATVIMKMFVNGCYKIGFKFTQPRLNICTFSGVDSGPAGPAGQD